MNCADFQKLLPEIFENPADLDKQEHLKECKVCSDLVSDLRYIAEQAKLLLPMRDPSPKVWENIQDSLQKDGIVQEQSSSGAHSAKKKA
jgi:hypothetical protein